MMREQGLQANVITHSAAISAWEKGLVWSSAGALLRERLQGIRSRLQYHGTQPKVRAELCTELAEIASFEP